MAEFTKEEILDFFKNMTEEQANDKELLMKYASASVGGRDPYETKEFYSTNWAKNYDKSAITIEYNGPQSAVTAFLELNLPKDSRILDIGCGTGLIGHLLQKNGYTNIDGLDISSAMLEVSKQKKCYTNLFESIVTKEDRLPMDDKTYDAIIMAGVLVDGHIKWDSFPQIIRVVKTGGIVLWVVGSPGTFKELKDQDKEIEQQNNDRIVESLCEQKVWKHLSGFPKSSENYLAGTQGLVYALQVI